jgi:hypothetical protein
MPHPNDEDHDADPDHDPDREDGRNDPIDDALDDEFPLGDGTADTEADVACPWCGEPVTIAVDPGGGQTQSYTEDCQICCRPWTVHVTFDLDGAALVSVEAEGDWDDA